ncbi:ASST-domain-containing protein [Aspergillus avenaceus]|uniref:ASST-domain-containing protein n=1 Tax=Aspergillus avenaceus TaxID=36643 RepID=A0A5N6TKX0_ASPAV|nr:ASST-domain-containing protein [Aspergillus avenaceus]
MATWLVFWFVLPLLATAFSWHSLWYELGLFGAHPTIQYESFYLESPEVDVLKWDPRCDDGYVFLSPRGHFYPEPGPLIYDNAGSLVWTENRFGMAMDLKVQRYKGQDYLTFWAGDDDGTRGLGSYYMLDSSYEIIHVVSAANGRNGDLHEFKITENGTALITVYEICQADLMSVGGPKDGWVYDGLFQEIDIETGELLFEWRALDHYRVEETYFDIEEKGHSAEPGDAFDYFHINSVDKNADGNYLISSRYMHTITCISPTGTILWVLGGKRNMFTDISADGSATGFTWQHNARWISDGVLTVFDNGAHEHLRTSDHTRGYMIELDFESWTATTLHVYDSPGHFSSHSQGSVQVLPGSDNVFIGWGKASAYTEFSLDGEVLCDTHWGPRALFWFGWVKSYRAYKYSWVGRPRSPPDIAVNDELRSVHVSWNGATDVVGWLVQRADDSNALDSEFETVDYVPKEGFETTVGLGDIDGHLRLVAIDSSGEELGYSNVFTLSHTGSNILSLPASMEDSLQHMLIAACAVGAILAGAWQGRKRVLSWLHY